MYTSHNAVTTHPEIVQGRQCDSLPGDVLRQLIQYTGVLLRVHTKHWTRNQLPMRSHSEMPRLYPWKVIKRALENQPTLSTHLKYRMVKVQYISSVESETPFTLFLTLLNLLKSTGYVMHQQFNIQQLYALPTLYLCVLYLSENKQRLVPLTA